MIDCGFYLRYSPGKDREKTSTIEAQLAMCQQKAKDMHFLVDTDHVYVDRGVSAATTERPGFQRLLQAIKIGSFPQVLICKDDSRLFRNELEAGAYMDLIWEMGVAIEYCLGPSGDPRESPQLRFAMRANHLVSQLMRDQKAVETRAHMVQNMKAGYANGGIPPYGYQRDEITIIDAYGVKKQKLRWKIDPQTAPAVRLAFDLFLAGQGYSSIAQQLTAAGYRSRRGNAILKGTVGSWMRQPYSFAGCAVWNVHDKKTKQIKPKSEWIIEGEVYEAIISLEEAEQAYQKAEKNKMRGVGKHSKYQRGKYVLSGLLKCAHCQQSFIIDSNHRRGNYFYICGQRKNNRSCDNDLWLHRGKLEELVIGEVQRQILQPGKLEEFYHQVKEGQKDLRAESGPRLGSLYAERRQLNNRLNHWLDLYGDGEMSKERLKERSREAEGRLEQVEQEIRQLESIRSTETPNLEDFRQALAEGLEQEAEIKKSILRDLIASIEVHADGKLEINYRIPMEPGLKNIPRTGFEPVSPA